MTSTSRPGRQRDLVRTFTAISSALNLKQPLGTTLDLIAEQVARTLGHRFSAIALYEQESNSFRIRGSFGLPAEYLEAVNTTLSEQIARHGLDGAGSVTVRAFRSRMPLQVDDITTDPGFEHWRAHAAKVGYTSAVFVPLIFRDEPIGALSCYDKERQYETADIDALQIVAEQTATAVGIAGLLDKQQLAIDALHQATRELDDRNHILRRCADATRTLTNLLLRHCSLEELLRELHSTLGSPVELYDASMHALAHAGTDVPEPMPPDSIVVPVDGPDVTYGHLAVGFGPNGPAEGEVALLEQAAMACALYFMREQAVAERQLRVASQLLNDLLTSDDPTVENGSVAARLHLDENQTYRIVTVMPTDPATPHTALPRRRIQPMTAALRRLHEYPNGKPPAVHAVLGSGIVAIVPATTTPDKLAAAVHAALVDVPESDHLQVAVSRPCSRLTDYRNRYRELRKCRELANQASSGIVNTVLAEDWHLHTMLMRTADDEDVRDRAHRILDPVYADGDDRLLTSLRTHLASQASVTRTAAALHVHPNTVKYRLRKLESLTGLDVRELPDLVELQLALAIHDLDPARFAAEAPGTR